MAFLTGLILLMASLCSLTILAAAIHFQGDTLNTPHKATVVLTVHPLHNSEHSKNNKR